MRLTRLQVQNYGNFEHLDLSFGAPSGAIELLVAPNGAGKSVLRQAVCELLFGMAPRTPMGFRFGYPRMRLSAEATLSDGTPLAFVRRKGNLNTLTDAADRPLRPELAARLPIERDRERMERLFALDSEQLVEGGRALLASGGDLADALLSGAGELRPARALVVLLKAQCDAAAPTRRKASTPFYMAADAAAEAERQLAASWVRAEDWATQIARLNAAEARRAGANAQVVEARIAMSRLRRIRATRRHLEALHDAAEWLDANGDAPALADGLGDRLAAALRDEQAAELRLADCMQQRDVAAARRAEVVPDEAVLALHADIAALMEERVRAIGSVTDQPKRRLEREAAEADIAVILRQLGSSRAAADAADELRPAADISTARGLIQAHTRIQIRAESAPETLARARHAAVAAKAALARLPPPARIDAVEDLLAEINAAGQPAAIMGQAQQAMAGAEADRTAALAQVPGWSGGFEALIALSVPAQSDFARLDRALQANMLRSDEAAKAHDADAARLAAVQRQCREHGRSGDLVDEQSVTLARDHRQTAWLLLRRRLQGAAPDEAAEAEFAKGRPIIDAYEEAVRGADGMADRRLAEIARTQQAAALAEELASTARVCDASLAGRAAAAAASADAGAAWSDACRGVGLPPDTGLDTVVAFIAARVKVIEAATATRRAAEQLARVEAQQAGWASRTAAVLGVPADTLPALAAAARLLVQQHRRVDKDRLGHEHALQVAEATIVEQAAVIAAGAAQMQAWSAAWQASQERLGRAANEAPETVSEMLDLLGRLATCVGEASAAARRLAEMRAQLDGFAALAATLAARLGDDASDPVAFAVAANRRVQAAEAQRVTAATLDDGVRSAEEALEQAQSGHMLASAAVQAVLRDAGAADGDAARGRIALSDERRKHARQHAAAMTGLAEEGEGLPIATLRAEADGIQADQLAERIGDAEAASVAAHAQAQEDAVDEERQRNALTRMTASDAASRAASALAAAQSTAGRVVEDALLHHTAAILLEAALGSVEASSDDPRLARIGRVFGALTLGAYNRVSSGETVAGGKPHRILLAHETGAHKAGAHKAGADGSKQVEHLSEGTRDQLYLALRLVAIEDHAASGAPALPFIADDILQTFDDGRALAAFGALAALSAHTQVIVLTHHEHLAALAATLPAGTVHIQRIGA